MSKGQALVTGGAGFIGSTLVDGLLAQGYEVRVLDNLMTGSLDNLAGSIGDIDFVEGDVRNADTAREASAGCELVFHLAALGSVPRSVTDPTTSTMINAVGTLNVLLGAQANAVHRVVFASSSSVYGANPVLPKRETLEPLPMSPYATAKLAGEGFCANFWHVHGLETVVLRYFNVFGPRQSPGGPYAAVIPLFVDALLNGKRPTINGDGLQTRDFTFVDDVVRANLLAAETPNVAGRKYNISCGHQVTVLELYRTLAELLGGRDEPLHAPERSGDIQHSFGSGDAAAADLGFTAEIALSEGLRRTAAHLTSERAINS